MNSMNSIRLIPTPIEINFSEADEKQAEFEREFAKFSEVDSDPILQWLNRARARNETKDSDEVALFLLLELHKKIDKLEKVVKGEQSKFAELSFHMMIEGSNYEHFKLKEPSLKVGKLYYGRLTVPVFPQRHVPLFFEAIDEMTAKISKMHAKDIADWDAYIVSRERAEIQDARKNF